MNVYLIQAAATTAAAFTLFGLSLKKNGQNPLTAVLSFPLSVLFGLLSAKISYVLLLQLDYIVEWGEWDVLLDLEPKRMCFVGGGIGVWLGVRLSARLLKANPRGVLDAFAAPGALLIAGLRLAEVHLGTLGAGMLTEGTGFFFSPPFTMTDSWGDRYLAVYFLEAAAALAIAVYAWFMKEKRTGIRFEKTVFLLALCQLLLENLRNQAMKWGFVYVEQVLCAVILMALMLLACSRQTGGGKRFLPALWLLICLGAVVGEEFARQKGSSEFLKSIGFAIMAAILAVMGVIYARAIRPKKTE